MIPIREGFLYFAATLDWYSRYVVSWKLSNSLESPFCPEILEEAFVDGQYAHCQQGPGRPVHEQRLDRGGGGGGSPESVDGKGRCFDSIF